MKARPAHTAPATGKHWWSGTVGDGVEGGGAHCTLVPGTWGPGWATITQVPWAPGLGGLVANAARVALTTVSSQALRLSQRHKRPHASESSRVPLGGTPTAWGSRRPDDGPLEVGRFVDAWDDLWTGARRSDSDRKARTLDQAHAKTSHCPHLGSSAVLVVAPQPPREQA
jgi:hypothetical protein